MGCSEEVLKSKTKGTNNVHHKTWKGPQNPNISQQMVDLDFTTLAIHQNWSPLTSTPWWKKYSSAVSNFCQDLTISQALGFCREQQRFWMSLFCNFIPQGRPHRWWRAGVATPPCRSPKLWCGTASRSWQIQTGCSAKEILPNGASHMQIIRLMLIHELVLKFHRFIINCQGCK